MAKVSDKLAALMLKVGVGVVGMPKKLLNAGIDPDDLSKKIVAKATAKFEKLKGGKSSSKAKAESNGKAASKKKKEDKADPKAKAKGKSKAAKAESNGKASKHKDKEEKSSKKKTKRKVNRTEHGQRHHIQGYPSSGFIRYMAVKGCSYPEAVKVARKFGAKDMQETTIRIAHADGKRTKKGLEPFHGRPAEVSKSDWKPVKEYIEKLRAI